MPPRSLTTSLATAAVLWTSSPPAMPGQFALAAVAGATVRWRGTSLNFSLDCPPCTPWVRWSRSPIAPLGTLDLSTCSWAFLLYSGQGVAATMTLRSPAPLSRTTPGDGVIGNPITPVVGNKGKGREGDWPADRLAATKRLSREESCVVVWRALLRAVPRRAFLRVWHRVVPDRFCPREREPPMRFPGSTRYP
jgi:hypothetical protein